MTNTMDTPLTPEHELPTVETPQELDTRSEIERERDEYKDGWMRAKADFQNYKRMEVDRVSSAITQGLGGLMEDLLRVLDSFQLALTTLEVGTPAEQGVRLIQAQLEDTLKQRGLEILAIQEGDAYDPAFAESIGVVPSAYPEGFVAQIVQKGYRWNGRVLRPARVQLAAPEQS